MHATALIERYLRRSVELLGLLMSLGFAWVFHRSRPEETEWGTTAMIIVSVMTAVAAIVLLYQRVQTSRMIHQAGISMISIKLPATWGEQIKDFACGCAALAGALLLASHCKSPQELTLVAYTVCIGGAVLCMSLCFKFWGTIILKAFHNAAP